MATCIRRDLDRTDACLAAARVLVRQTAGDETVRPAIVEACATECRTHDHDHRRLCAQLCRACVRDCRAAIA